MVQAVLPTLITQSSGCIVNIGSLGGRIGLPMNGAYAASKFALEGLSESLRLELAPLGLHVSTVVPGPVATDTLDRSIREAPVSEGPFAARRAALVRRMRADGARSTVTPADVAHVVVSAVEAAARRSHYTVGALATWMPRMKAWLPPRVFEAFLRRSFG
jgi:short-subunit dehydrogenase